MYRVSPMPRPIIPLAITIVIVWVGSEVSVPIWPARIRIVTRMLAFVARRMMFAEMGLVFVSAFLYIMGAIAQLMAAPRAASSPIIGVWPWDYLLVWFGYMGVSLCLVVLFVFFGCGVLCV